MAGTDYKVISRHAEELASGRPVEPGEYISLTDEEKKEPHNRRLIDDGILLPVDMEALEEAEENAPTHEDLQAEAKRLGLKASGNKGDLEQRIAEHKAKEGGGD